MKAIYMLIPIIGLFWHFDAQAKLHHYKCFVDVVGGNKGVVDVEVTKDDPKEAARAAVKEGLERPQKSALPVTKVYQCVERGQTFANPEARQLDREKLR